MPLRFSPSFLCSTHNPYSPKILSYNSQSSSAQIPIFFHAIPVVHMQVYTRTHGSVHTYTWQCTHVHCHVYDRKSKDLHWQLPDLQLVTTQKQMRALPFVGNARIHMERNVSHT